MFERLRRMSYLCSRLFLSFQMLATLSNKIINFIQVDIVIKILQLHNLSNPTSQIFLIAYKLVLFYLHYYVLTWKIVTKISSSHKHRAYLHNYLLNKKVSIANFVIQHNEHFMKRQYSESNILVIIPIKPLVLSLLCTSVIFHKWHHIIHRFKRNSNTVLLLWYLQWFSKFPHNLKELFKKPLFRWPWIVCSMIGRTSALGSWE